MGVRHVQGVAARGGGAVSFGRAASRWGVAALALCALLRPAGAFDFDDDEVVADAPAGGDFFGGADPAEGISVPVTHALGAGAPTVWWHQVDDENDESYEVRDFSEWHATKDMRKARLHLMNNRATEGVAALEKLRSDLLLYARDAG